MNTIRALLIAIVATVALVASSGTPGPTAAQQATIAVDPFIWQLSEDYPGANQNDAALPIKRVLIKTHDGTDWMSTYDDHPNAVSGPAALKSLVDTYRVQGIEVVAWFVPKGTNVQAQLTMAKQAIDTPGVKGLYADVEPFSGFCTPNCEYLADNFWSKLREQRPNARLGVIYDARDPWVDFSHAKKWLKNADVALPMCYWESFFGQGAWSKPDGCLIQAYHGIREMIGNQQIEYEPALQGDPFTSDISGFIDRFEIALDTALDLGSERVTVWRRGVVRQETWDAVAGYTGTIDRPCWLNLPDGCLIGEIGRPEVYIVAGGAKFHVPNPQALYDMGFTFADVDPAPQGFMATLPNIPRDGALIRELKQSSVYVVYAKARLPVGEIDIASTPARFNLELATTIPPGGLAQVPTMPEEYSRFKEDVRDEQYVIIKGARVHVSGDQIKRLNEIGYAKTLYVVTEGGLSHIPVRQIPHGDISCDGAVNASDALFLLLSSAGVPNTGVCSTPDIDCDGATTIFDPLALLQAISGLEAALPDGCPVPVATE